jgi:2-dehydro-3-deoxygalactonokinase
MDDVVLIDWGTSSFRAVIINEAGEIGARSASDAGIMNVPKGDFLTYLTETLEALDVAHNPPPVLMSGMIGSTLGWCEAPYLTGQQSLDDFAKNLFVLDDRYLDIRIVPGVTAPSLGLPEHIDVMRGEETQFFGSLILRQSTETSRDVASLICIPGTHAKWIVEIHGTIDSFATFMTGELFSVLSRYSVVSGVLAEEQNNSYLSPAFFEGLDMALQPMGVMHHAFLLRAGTVTGGFETSTNRDRLSGICIGSEIASMRPYIEASGHPVTLIASGVMRVAYEQAFTYFKVPYKIIDAEAATIAGQLALHKSRS